MKGKVGYITICSFFVLLMALPVQAQQKLAPRQPIVTDRIEKTPISPTGPAVKQPILRAPARQQLKVEIDPRNLSAKNSSVVQCRIVNVPLEGKNLNFISGASVIDLNGRTVPGIRGRLDWKAYMDGGVQRRNTGVEAQCNASPGNYILLLYQGDKPVANGNYYVTVYERLFFGVAEKEGG